MSDTPRTDAAEAFDDEGRMVTASFARTLERETISLRDKLADREAKLSAARAELATAREHESAALSGQRQLLACHDGALRQLEEARAMFATAMRLWRNRYLPWTDAGGVDECKHGFGSGIPCGPCDDEAVRQYERKAAGMDATAGEVKA